MDKQPSPNFIRVSRGWRLAVQNEELMRAARDQAIYAEHKAGVRQRDIVAETGLTRETVRRIIEREKSIEEALITPSEEEPS